MYKEDAQMPWKSVDLQKARPGRVHTLGRSGLKCGDAQHNSRVQEPRVVIQARANNTAGPATLAQTFLALFCLARAALNLLYQQSVDSPTLELRESTTNLDVYSFFTSSPRGQFPQ